jgi:hypothetical protein
LGNPSGPQGLNSPGVGMSEEGIASFLCGARRRPKERCEDEDWG